jgi:glutamine amidotransferase
MIGIIDYDCGNIASVKNMLNYLGYENIIVNDKQTLDKVKFIIMPGVGNFKFGINQLSQMKYMPKLLQKISNEGVPTLGICMGMQLLTSYSEEGDCPGLDLIKLQTKKFPSSGPIPNMGWLKVMRHGSSELAAKSKFYFVHSYYVEFSEKYTTYFSSYNDVQFSAAFCKDNIMGCQFHPEKSHRFGMEYFKTILSDNYE